MTNEFAERRKKIIAFLNGLTQREKLVVLACLSNDAAISARIPDLAKTVFDMQRTHYRAELLALAGTERSSLDLRLLARRKGCRLEPAEGPVGHFHIVHAGVRRIVVDSCTMRGARVSVSTSGGLPSSRRSTRSCLRTIPTTSSREPRQANSCACGHARMRLSTWGCGSLWPC